MRVVGWILACAVLASVTLVQNIALALNRDPFVLLVHGGHVEDAWSTVFARGLETELMKGLSAPGLLVRQEYLDASTLADLDSLAPLAAYFKAKYHGLNPDVLVADGDAASRFLLKSGAELFPDSPLILVGVANGFVDRLHSGDIPRAWRIFAPLEVKATLELALSLQSGVRRVACLVDQSRESRAVAKVLEDALRDYEGRITSELVDIGEGASRAQLLERVRGLDAKHVAIYAGFSLRGADGLLPAGLTLDELCAACPQPLFALTDLSLGRGVVGGKLMEVSQLGRLAGSTTLALLSPEQAALSPSTLVVSRFLFDASVLKRFKIAPKALPQGSAMVSTKPESPAYSTLSLVGWAVAGLLLLAMTVLLSRFWLITRGLGKAATELEAGAKEDISAAAAAQSPDEPVAKADHEKRQGSLQDESLDSLLHELPYAVLVLLHDGELAYANAVARAWLATDPQALTRPLLAPEAVSTCLSQEFALLGPEGDERHVELRSHPIVWDGQPGVCACLHDATHRRRAELALLEAEEFRRIVADHTFDWELWMAEDGRLLYSSPSCERITGFTRDAFSEDPGLLERIIHPEDLPLWKKLQPSASNATYDMIDLRIQHLDARTRWVCVAAQRVSDSLGVRSGLRYSIRDVSERKQIEQQLQHYALHDHLTGVGNRTLAMDRILLGLERCKRRNDYFFAVAFLGLDRFKLVNESLGYALGDKVLAEIARRLGRAVRELDTVARFGGDEFVLLLEELGTPREATGVINRVLEEIRKPLLLDGRDLRVTASAGVVLNPASMNQPEDLLRNATIAMYRAKQAGRDRFKVFNSRMLDRAVWAMRMEMDLRRALEADEFFLMYQPIVKLPGGELVGFEALVRWNHPARGVIAPGEFIPLAEETGQIVELGQWVLKKACETLASWRQRLAGASHLLVSVNISGRQFGEPGLLDQIKRCLQNTGLPATCLKLEITETAIMGNAQHAIDRLVRLKNLGVELSIDDFGTGYSSMSYLQKFPLDNLKIDLSFVRMMEAAKENIEIVKLIIDLAHNLDIEVVAEGVENVLQSRLLISLGCEYAQGYYYSRPLLSDAAEAFILAYAPQASAPSMTTAL